MAGEPLLVVDDNPVNVKLLRMLLGDAERVLAAGCDACVTKPIDLHALLSLVASRLRP